MILGENTIITKIQKVAMENTSNSKWYTKDGTFFLNESLESNKISKEIVYEAYKENKNVAIHYSLNNKKIIYTFYPKKDFVFEVQKSIENPKIYTVALAMRPTLIYLDMENRDFEKIKGSLEVSKKEKRKLLIAINPESSFIEAVLEDIDF